MNLQKVIMHCKSCYCKSIFSADGSGVDLESLIMPPMVVLSPGNVQIAELIFEGFHGIMNIPIIRVSTIFLVLK
ncbi:MAG: hypothetical protein CM1200mP38_2420 [Dehalococcoidia bacterium]|nr:MAG: hypothetical protein CM1200mP38_2420 [Dehalococcoidia bacterium]